MTLNKSEKSSRNKTIDFQLDSELFKEYSSANFSVDSIGKDTDIKDKIFCGDTFKACKKLPCKFADLIIADPPYNLTKDYHGEHFSSMNDEKYAQFTEKWLFAIIPLLKDDGTLYVCCDWRSGMVISRILDENLNLRGRITWQREKGRGAKSNWKNGMEDVYYATKSEKFKFNLDAVKIRRRVIAPYKSEGKPKDWEETKDGKFRDTCPSNFWDDISIPYWSMAENTAHPTQKPEKLLAKLILASSDENDVVFDPFGGSGSTAVTAKKLGRHFVSVEQNPLYCAWAQKRLCDADEDKSIQGYQNGVFYERNTSDYLARKSEKAKNESKDLKKQ